MSHVNDPDPVAFRDLAVELVLNAGNLLTIDRPETLTTDTKSSPTMRRPARPRRGRLAPLHRRSPEH